MKVTFGLIPTPCDGPANDTVHISCHAPKTEGLKLTVQSGAACWWCRLPFMACVIAGIAIGGDVFPGSTLSDHCLRYQNIPEIKLIVVLGELGGQVGFCRVGRRHCDAQSPALRFYACSPIAIISLVVLHRHDRTNMPGCGKR